MAESLPLPALLSHLLVAFTIEFDNEFEDRMPHWTTSAGIETRPGGGTWLVSQVMWVNVMQYVDGEGISVADLGAWSRTTPVGLKGLERWRYVTLADAPGQDERIVRPTASGRRAQDVWRPLAAEVEERWHRRFGPGAIDGLRRSLSAVRDQFEVELPGYLPIVYPTQNGKAEAPRPVPPAPPPTPTPDLSVLLAQVLLHFALDYEEGARLSLTIAANTLRVLDAAGVRIRDLPTLTGVSKEGNAMALGFLSRRGCVVLEPDPSTGRGKRARLTPRGKQARDKYLRLLAQTEQRWNQRFGADNVENLRESLVGLVGDRVPLRESILFEGLTPHPRGWRASIGPPGTLPYYPMVLHRGGYPDGS